MIIASLNGTYGQGYVEVIEHSDGSVERAGVLKLSVPSAKRLERWLESNEPLTYTGPVLTNSGWRAETLSIVVTNVAREPEVPELVSVWLRSCA